MDIMKSRYFIIMLAALLAACSSQRRAFQAETLPERDGRYDRTQQEGGQRILYPEEHPLYGQTAQTVQDQSATARTPRPDRPGMTFTQAQSEHVRLQSERYPSGTRITLDLDELAKEYYLPYKGEFLSDYGTRNRAMHTGVDIRTVPDDTIRAAFPGVVRMSKDYSSYGNIVVIKHYGGFETVYAHASKNLVNVNDVVEPGDPIALGGRTGRATTEHLHFEVRVGAEPVDPNKLIDFSTGKMRSGTLYITQLFEGLAVADSPAGVVLAEEERTAAALRAGEERAEVDARIAARLPAEPQPEYYRVQSGDTLSAIARKYGTTVTKLCELNGIRSTSILQINQRLRVK